MSNPKILVAGGKENIAHEVARILAKGATRVGVYPSNQIYPSRNGVVTVTARRRWKENVFRSAPTAKEACKLVLEAMGGRNG